MLEEEFMTKSRANPIKKSSANRGNLLKFFSSRTVCLFGLGQQSVLNKSSKETGEATKHYSPEKINEGDFPWPICQYGIVCKIVNPIGDNSK